MLFEYNEAAERAKIDMFVKETEDRAKQAEENAKQAESENEHMSELVRVLMNAKRYDDVERITSDVEYRHKLYTEFGINKVE